MIPSDLLFPYIASNVLAASLVLTSFLWPRAGRVVFMIIFTLAGLFNGYAVLTTPDVYVSSFGGFAVFEGYRSFINGFFHEHTQAIVLAIAMGQMCITVLLAGRRTMRWAGVIGGTIFLLAIAPLGIGSAFPCTILLAFALLLTSWRERPRAIAPKEHRTIARPVV